MRSMCCLFVLLILVFVIVGSASAEFTRHALVIGNAAYPEPGVDHLFGPLANPGRDAEDMAAVLQQYGFQVIAVKNADPVRMNEAIDRFLKQLARDGVGLFYFSGHGVQVENYNYLIPVGRNFADARDVKYYALNATWLLEKIEASGTRVNIMILDACREHMPVDKSKGLGEKGLAQMVAKGAIISYATAPGDVAYDVYNDLNQPNSIYTRHLLDAIRKNSRQTLDEVFNQARTTVAQATDNKQVPWTESSLIGKFCFEDCTQSTPTNPEITKLLKACEQHFQANRLTSGRGGTALDCYEQVLQIDPSNAEALAGLDKIEARYVELIQQARNKGDQSKVQQYIATLRMVKPESPRLAEIEAELPTPAQAVSNTTAHSWNTGVWNQSQWQ